MCKFKKHLIGSNQVYLLYLWWYYCGKRAASTWPCTSHKKRQNVATCRCHCSQGRRVAAGSRVLPLQEAIRKWLHTVAWGACVVTKQPTRDRVLPKGSSRKWPRAGALVLSRDASPQAAGCFLCRKRFESGYIRWHGGVWMLTRHLHVAGRFGKESVESENGRDRWKSVVEHSRRQPGSSFSGRDSKVAVYVGMGTLCGNGATPLEIGC